MTRAVSYSVDSCKWGTTTFILTVVLGLPLVNGETAFSQSSVFPRKTDWTVSEVKAWAENEKEHPTWHGSLLYQGSDSLNHHFISRVMDEWVWFNIKRTDLAITDEKVFNKTSSAPLGYYYVDATNNFIKTKDYKP